jgi:hypothetical protein
LSAQAANGRRPRRRRPGLGRLAAQLASLGPAIFDCQVLALDEACVFEALAKSAQPSRMPVRRLRVEKPDHRNRRLLRSRRGRPRRRATEQRDELTRCPLMGMHLIPSRVRNASLGYRIGADQSGGRCTAKFQSSLCRLRVIHVVLRCPRYVRSSPNSGGKADVAALLIRAMTGLMHRSKRLRVTRSLDPRQRAASAGCRGPAIWRSCR